jgi:class 3 adenylate cyclase/tetratricopeptide (TPR) repeat protein
MKCANCRTENREGMKFCEQCGAKMEQECPNCKAKIPQDSKFCGECGHNLRALKQAPSIDYSQPRSYTPKFLAEKILTTRDSIEGERKLVTVLFADVANFTALSERLDPEEVHGIMDGCFGILMDEVHTYEGTINQFTGDGVMALFGAPVAHEDHAQRACRAALSAQKAIEAYAEKVMREFEVEFEMRMGLHSGPVIVGSIGDDLRMDYTAVGDTTNLAARIQQVATPRQVWVSQETHHMIRNYFHDEFVLETPLKGKAEPQRLYRVVSEQRGVRTRFEAGMARGMTELVGRRLEMEALRGAFRKAKGGKGQVVDVVGEAGIGKSRLLYEFQKALGDDVKFLRGICIQYGRNINFLPVIDIVRGAFGVEEARTEEELGKRIEEKATQNLAPMIPFYRSLLSLKVEDPMFKALEPEGRKLGTFEAVKNLLIALSEQKPLVVFVDDVHWMDKMSEELLAYFSRCIVDQPILLLAAYRPEGAPPWAQGTHYQRLGLESLSSRSSVRLVRNVLGGPALESKLEEKIVEKTEGNPFFMEEIVRELLERGDLVKEGDRYVCRHPLDRCEIPNTIQGVLAARMDRLSDDLKRTVQIASVIGRDFAFRLLKSIMELGDELRSQLTNLVGLEILYEKALYPEIEYIFKHALTQEVAYDSLLKQRRREIHGRIAQAIEELYADRIEEHYELVAHHYERSGNAEKAVHYLILAGEKSNKHGAVQAGCEFLDKALAISEKAQLPLRPEEEVRLHYERGQSHMGVGAIDAAANSFRRALELSRRHGMAHFEREGLVSLAYLMYMWPSREEADLTLKEGLARARETQDKGLESTILSTMSLRSVVYERQRGNQEVLDAEPIALESGDPRSILGARLIRSIWERHLGRPRKTVELTEGMIELLQSSYNINITSNVIWIRGVALAEIGQMDEAVVTMTEGIDMCERFGALYRLDTLYNCLGYCYGEVYQLEHAMELNTKAEEIARMLKVKYPFGRRQWAHGLGEAVMGLTENLFDQGNEDTAWKRLKSLEQESRSEDFDMNRYQWESRLNLLTAQILLHRNDIGAAEAVIEKNLASVRTQHMKKREGSFLRLLGEVQRRRNEYESAVTTLNEAIRVLTEVENPRQLWQAHDCLASTLKEMKRSSEAREQWGRAAKVIQNSANALSDRGLREGFLKAQPIREILSQTEQ